MGSLREEILSFLLELMSHLSAGKLRKMDGSRPQWRWIETGNFRFNQLIAIGCRSCRVAQAGCMFSWSGQRNWIRKLRFTFEPPNFSRLSRD